MNRETISIHYTYDRAKEYEAQMINTGQYKAEELQVRRRKQRGLKYPFHVVVRK